MRYAWIFFVFILVMGLASATDVVRKESCTSIIQSCGNCTYSNVTSVLYPNGSIDLASTAMTKTGTVYNLTFCKTTSTGNYLITGLYNPTGSPSTWNYNFLVNAQGKMYTTTDGLVYIGIIGILIMIFLVGLYSSIAIPFTNPRNELNQIINIDYKKHIKLFAVTMTYLSFVALCYFSWNLSYGILEFPELAQWFYVLFRIAFVIMIGFIPVVFVIGIIQVFRDNKLKKMMDRGLTVK